MSGKYQFIPSGGVTSPAGFLADAVYSGLKTPGKDVLDLGILYSEVPCATAGMFTASKVKAAPVVLCQRRLAKGRAQAVVVNAGQANACVGEQGMADAIEMTSLTARKLGLAGEDILVASTGVIGVPLPMEHVRSGIGKITLSRQGGHDLARAMMTTDTFPKEMALAAKIGGKEVILGGVAKGAGMIHPNLATMLCFVTTDAAVEPALLPAALRRVVDATLNMVTVDGDTSTNDTVLLLANGMARNEVIRAGSPEAETFEAALHQVCLYLARCLARDGEGATRLMEVLVEGALTLEEARAAARTIAGSSLVKAAVYGSDPNWGRVIAALGRSGAEVVESKTDLYLGTLSLLKSGGPVPFDAAEAKALLGQKDVSFRVGLNLGQGKATAWGCDLTPEYVTINSAYST